MRKISDFSQTVMRLDTLHCQADKSADTMLRFANHLQANPEGEETEVLLRLAIKILSIEGQNIQGACESVARSVNDL